MSSRSSRSISRSGALRIGLATLSVWLSLSLALGGCRRNVPSPPSPAPSPSSASSAPSAPFVHPEIPPEPAPQARPECSYLALGRVAARIRETQGAALRAAEPRRSKRAKDRTSGCGSPAMSELESQVKGDLADRVRICVGQDGPLDAEWNLLDASLASLGVCVDCARPAPSRSTDCQRAGSLITQAESEAAAREKAPASALH